jgi:hypothetical protein
VKYNQLVVEPEQFARERGTDQRRDIIYRFSYVNPPTSYDALYPIEVVVVESFEIVYSSDGMRNSICDGDCVVLG